MKKTMTLTVGLMMTMVVFVWNAPAQVTTDPVGFVKVPVLGNSDATVSVPFSRAPVFMGRLQAVSDATITVAGTPFQGKNVAEGHYVRVLSGTKKGLWSTILANSDNTLVVEDAGTLAGSVAGDRFGVYPHQTLDSIFPAALAGISYKPTTNPFSRQTEVLAMDLAGQGINRAPLRTYYYYNGAWRLVGAPIADNMGGTVLYPETPMILRNNGNMNELSFLTLGHVMMGAVGRRIPTLATANDLLAATGRPATLTLNQLELGGTPSFKATTSLLRTDELYVFDNQQAGINKAPVATYYYLQLGGNIGWRKVGRPVTEDWGDVPVLELSNGFLIRKVGGTLGVADWIAESPY